MCIQRHLGELVQTLDFAATVKMVTPTHFQQAERYDRATSNFFNPLHCIERHGPASQRRRRPANSQACFVQRKAGSNPVVAYSTLANSGRQCRPRGSTSVASITQLTSSRSSRGRVARAKAAARSQCQQATKRFGVAAFTGSANADERTA